MAFSFANSGTGSPAQAAGVQTGPDLEDIQTEALGFLSFAGEAKVQLLPTPWPSDQLPPPTSSLMSVASQKGLVAAAGPDAVIVATTESVRKAFESPDSGDGNLRPFQPQLKLPMPMKVSQLAFSADESYLVLSAETGGGLAVYDVQALLQNSTQSAFELSTNGQALRALSPNPTPEKGELLALVTTDGNLMMANLKERSFVSGSNGQVLKTGVSCVSWSTKGKQLVAGLGDGTAYQMTPEGVSKAEIPRPPNVDQGDYVSSISWLENHVFLVVHTPSSFDNSQAPQSTFHVITRQPPANFTFQKISDPAGPFGLNRSPPHHFILRLKDFPPNLQDVILVASTASIDIGLFSRSKVPLTNDKPADKISGVFTMTEMADDSRRAQLPMSPELADTSPIGFALDLSSKDKVPKPIPADEMDESATPLPALMVLNNEGVLASWWVIYSESIRQGTVYPGLVAGSASLPTQASPVPTQAPSSAFAAPTNPAFGSSSFGSTASNFGSTTTFGSLSLPGTAGGTFGGPSALGKSKSPWSTPSTSTSTAPLTSSFGAFGSTPSIAALKPAFGAPSFGTTSTPTFGLANRASPWATGGSTAPNAAFGQAGGLAKPVFGAPASTNTTPATSSGFAAFATKGGFAAPGASSSPTGSIFGSKPTSNPFGLPTVDSSMEKGSLLGGAVNKADAKPTFGSGSFILNSTFKADPSTKDDISEASNEPKNSFFGGAFSNALGESTKSANIEAPVSKEADMDSDDALKQEPSAKAETTTPVATPAAPKTQLFGSTIPDSGLFGTPTISSTPPTKPVSTGFSFGQQTTDKPKTAGFSFASLNSASSLEVPKTPIVPVPKISTTPATTPSAPQIKQEPRPETPPISKKIPEAPLPPDSTSKTSYALGESSVSSVEPDAPLPPDFIPKPAPKTSQQPESLALKKTTEKPIATDFIPPPQVPGGPNNEGDDDSDFLTEEEGEDGSEEPSEEGSGEDIAKDLSPTSEANQTPGFTPQSSFGGTKNRGQESNMFTKIEKPREAQTQRSLFGEINRSAALILPPPRVHQSPRSPSPMRAAVPPRMRPDASRSVSAPGAAFQASQILGSQRSGGRSTIPTQSPLAVSEAEQEAEAQRRTEIRARRDAEETQTLVDVDDDRIQGFLASDLKPTTTLDEFVAHSDYVGDKSMESIPAQVETVYRDINSMIDTLGVNARALKCFIQGHNDQYKDEGRTIEDFEEDKDEWCLVEVEDLSNLVEINLTRQLEDSRVKDLAAKLETCNDLQKDLIRLRAKHEDIKKIIDCYRDPSHLALARAQPLSAEQVAQQHDLRRDFTKFQKLLSEAEEGLTVLKAKTVSQATSNGGSNGSSGPTVEAVMRTITKMTSMAEKRSGDIDVLEGQMRRLRSSSTTSVGSREGSPFATPQNSRTSLRHPGTSSTYGLFYTPDSIKDTPQRFQNSLMASTGSQSRNSPPRKKLSGYTAEEKAQLKTKLARKKEVTNKLRAALQKAGTNVRLMDDDGE